MDLRDHVAFSTEAATRVRVFNCEHLAYDLWCIEPRQATPVLHDEERDTTYTVIGGRSWFVTEEGEVGLDPLGAMLVPAGIVHGIDNRDADPLIVTAVSSPPSPEPEAPPVTAHGEAIREPRESGGIRRLLARILGGGSAGVRD